MDITGILKDRMENIAAEIENFIFAENRIEKADVIFVPGNGYPEMAEAAARLYHEGIAPYIIPSGRYSITLGRFGGVLHNREKYLITFLKNIQHQNFNDIEIILVDDNSTDKGIKILEEYQKKDKRIKIKK